MNDFGILLTAIAEAISEKDFTPVGTNGRLSLLLSWKSP